VFGYKPAPNPMMKNKTAIPIANPTTTPKRQNELKVIFIQT
jgi:hypothetical protein